MDKINKTTNNEKNVTGTNVLKDYDEENGLEIGT